MDERRLSEIVRASRERQDSVMFLKGQDYTRRSGDRLANFKRVALEAGVSPLQAWAVYILKHWDAVMTYVTTGTVESEDIRERFVDLHNYLYLGEALIEEELLGGTKKWTGEE